MSAHRFNLRQAIIKSLSKAVTSKVANDDGSFFGLSIQEIMQRLHDTYAIYSRADIEIIEMELESIYDLALDLPEFVATMKIKFSTLIAAGQPISEKVKIDYLKNALMPSGIFADAMTAWFIATPLLQNQTFDDFSEAMVTLDENRPRAPPMMLPVQHLLADTVAANAKAYEKGVKDGRSQMAQPKVRAAPSKNAGGKAASGGSDHYCWSHGSNQSHWSWECKKHSPGHVAGANFFDKKGGKT